MAAESTQQQEVPSKPESYQNTADLNNSSIVWVESHPECSVCLQPCLQPVQLPCLHVFCFLCLKGFAYRSKKCALCRSEVKMEYFDKPLIVKVKNSSKSPEKEVEKYNWFYEGRNGWWQYDERASTVLEEAFKSEARSCELLIAGFLYLVDFENMVQFRKTHPARCRRIKRDKVGVDRKGIAGLKLKSSAAEKEALEKSDSKQQLVTAANSGPSSTLSSTELNKSTSSGHVSSSNVVNDDLAAQLDRTL